jgi:hypothetical protein
MLLFILLLAVGVIGVVVAIIVVHSTYDNGTISGIIFGLAMVCLLLMISFGIVAIITAIRRDVVYDQMSLQYEQITKQLENDSNNYYLLYSDIKEYNNAILRDRKFGNNLWLNWYYNGKIQYLPLIGG